MMFRPPPPDIAMRLADQHRNDLMASAAKRPTDAVSVPRRFSSLHSLAARLGQLVRSPQAPALTPGPPSKAARIGSERSSVQRVGRSWVEGATKEGAQ